MAALVVQSRFAGLKIEDDDSPASSERQGKKSRANAQAAKKTEPSKKAKNTTNAKSQNVPKKKKSKPIPATEDQWEQWKQKDEELVDGNYEDELHQAILLSKLDFEEKKDVYKAVKKETEAEKKAQGSGDQQSKKKNKKKNVMSLDQFNEMVTGEDPPKYNIVFLDDDKHSTDADDTKPPEVLKDTEFFDRIKDDTRNEILKDKIKDRVRKQRSQPDEVITRVQFADALERKEKEIEALRKEVASLKEELHTVKSRNKKLCNILGQGEMKDKAEVLMEVERLRTQQTELTAELADLHSQLEKERSRNTDSRGKDKKKKAANGDKEK